MAKVPRWMPDFGRQSMVVKGRFHQGSFGDKHNSLFGPGPVGHLNACVGRNGGPADFGGYARGYFTAGRWIVERAVQERMEVDLIVYPLVMTYRQGVEAMLKQLAATLSFLCTDKQKWCKTHDLTDNWGIAKKYLPEIDVPKEEIDEADSIIKDLVEIDPKGEVFRYPLSRDCDRHLDGTSLINILVFAEGIDKLATFLESCTDWAAHNLQLKADMESEMRSACDYEVDNYY
jgi:hypothetical protein